MLQIPNWIQTWGRHIKVAWGSRSGSHHPVMHKRSPARMEMRGSSKPQGKGLFGEIPDKTTSIQCLLMRSVPRYPAHLRFLHPFSTEGRFVLIFLLGLLKVDLVECPAHLKKRAKLRKLWSRGSWILIKHGGGYFNMVKLRTCLGVRTVGNKSRIGNYVLGSNVSENGSYVWTSH